MIPILVALWTVNYRVYGAHKLWEAARRAGHQIGRDQVARLMRTAGIEGVRRFGRVRTTRPDDTAARHPDLVQRNFTATAPNQLWVTDITYVATWVGVAYVCFIVDACSRMIVDWRVAGHMRTEMVLDAVDWPAGIVAPALTGCAATPPPARNSLVSAGVSTSPSSAPCPRSDLSATPMTTRWPRRSSGSTRPS
jgi:putative transposase